MPVPILAVDDRPANLIALTALTESLGVELVTAESGREGLAIAAERELALILLDVMMPDMDGFATLERLRELPLARHVPVIFLTAHDAEPPAVRRAYELGAVDFIAKPIEAEILRAKLRAFVTLYRQTRTIRELAQNNETKNRHIGILAHDLRNPLSMVTFGAAVLDRHTDEAVRTTARRLERAARRMTRLIEDMLVFASKEAGKLHVTRERTDLVVLANALLDDFATIHPTVRFERRMPAQMNGHWDAGRVQQALSNLITNAVQYGDGWVLIQLEELPTSVRVCVENGGAPIPAEQLSIIFEPFERGTSAQRGTGLGLHIVREIARAHGGEVDVKSDGGGTTFRMLLPLTL